jgi:hypothetical protein
MSWVQAQSAEGAAAGPVFCIFSAAVAQTCLYPALRAANACATGWVAEWFKALVLKTSVRESVPWVRIPPHPPLALAKAFSRSGCGRIFPLFSRVMRVRLLTGPRAVRPRSGLSGPIFSGPVNRWLSGEQLYPIEKITNSFLPREAGSQFLPLLGRVWHRTREGYMPTRPKIVDRWSD